MAIRCAFANGRKDDWDRQLPLAEFAINNADSVLGDGLTPFFIDRGAHPRLPLSPPRDDRAADDSPGHYAHRMRLMEATVRELLAAAQAARKAKLDVGRVDTVFKVGDRVVLLTKELLDAADIGKLRPRWDGPFEVTACPGPNAYTLALPPRMLCSSTVNVDRLKPFFERAGVAPPPGPVSDAGQEGDHEVERLLNRTEKRGVTRYLVRWRGHTSADDEWLRAEELPHCQEKARVAEYDAAAPRRRAARRADPAAEPAAAPPAAPPPPPAPLVPPAGFRLAASTEGLTRRGGPRRPGGVLPLASGGLDPRNRDWTQPGCWVLARGAVRPRLCSPSRVGGGAIPAPSRRCLARPGRPLGASPTRSSPV